MVDGDNKPQLTPADLFDKKAEEERARYENANQLEKLAILEERGVLTQVFQYNMVNPDGSIQIYSTICIAPNTRLKNLKEIQDFMNMLPVSDIDLGVEPLDSEETVWLPERHYLLQVGEILTGKTVNLSKSVDAETINNMTRARRIRVGETAEAINQSVNVTVYPSVELAQAVANLTRPGLHSTISVSIYDQSRPALDLSDYDERQERLYRGFDAFIPAKLWPEKLITLTD